jgi:hypothetical protein
MTKRNTAPEIRGWRDFHAADRRHSTPIKGRNSMNKKVLTVIRYLVAVIVLAGTGSTLAQTLPRSFAASPDIYKVVGEDDKYLVIEANYKPGQRSTFFSTPAYLSYLVTDCHLRKHYPDGQIVDNGPSPAGFAIQQPAYDSISIENVGKKACRTVFFAPK